MSDPYTTRATRLKLPLGDARVHRWSARGALGLLVALSAVAAHQITYAVSFGSGAAYHKEMTSTGHDTYFAPLVAAILISALGLAIVAALQVWRLAARAASPVVVREDEGPRTYLVMVTALWVRLAVLTALAYTLQENAERVLLGGPPLWIEALLAQGLLPLGVILVTALLVALVGALFCWRRQVLLARLARTRFRHGTAPPELPRPSRFVRPRASRCLSTGAIRAPPGAVAAA